MSFMLIFDDERIKEIGKEIEKDFEYFMLKHNADMKNYLNAMWC